LGQAMFDHELEAEFTKVITLDKDHLTESRNKLKFLQDRDKFTLD